MGCVDRGSLFLDSFLNICQLVVCYAVLLRLPLSYEGLVRLDYIECDKSQSHYVNSYYE